MKRLSDQQLKWCKILEKSTNPQEIIETAAKLGMDTVTMEEAKEIAEMHKPEKRPTWDDFFNVSTRQEKEAILQKILGESLTPEEMEKFFPKD